MSVRMKITHSKTASRRSHHHASVATVVKTDTGVRRKHFMDPVTGMYRGKQILSVAQAPVKVAKTTKKKSVKKTDTTKAKKTASAKTAEKKS
jgi:ribosomal protein L32